jgi:hypothetical protein
MDSGFSPDVSGYGACRRAYADGAYGEFPASRCGNYAADFAQIRKSASFLDDVPTAVEQSKLHSRGRLCCVAE